VLKVVRAKGQIRIYGNNIISQTVVIKYGKKKKPLLKIAFEMCVSLVQNACSLSTYKITHSSHSEQVLHSVLLLSGVVVSVLATGPKGHGFKPG
jgi:phosphoribosyl-dephospho-CoA transferase